MTKNEKLNLALANARSFVTQGRFAEAKLIYENIIKDLQIINRKLEELCISESQEQEMD